MDGPLPRPSHHCGRLYLALAPWSHSVIADALKICCTWISPSQHEAQSKDKINRKFCQHCHLKSLLTIELRGALISHIVNLIDYPPPSIFDKPLCRLPFIKAMYCDEIEFIERCV